MIEDIKESAELFRLGQHTRANELFIRIIDGIQDFQKQQVIPVPGLLGLLSKILGAQQRGDNSHIADLLEYELIPLLEPHLKNDKT